MATICRMRDWRCVGNQHRAGDDRDHTFGQFLNGDGHIGIPFLVVIQTDGTTALTEVGNNFFLDNTGSNTGPELQFGGSPLTPALLGTWTPIGAIQVTGGGYDVALHNASSGLYTVWSTDSNGNYLSNVIGAVSGTSTALESPETTLQSGSPTRRWQFDRNSRRR